MYYFIVNPKSSSGKGMKLWNRAAQILAQEDISYQVFFTTRVGHARDLAAKLSTEKIPCTIVVVGGDGTINEVIDGLTNYQQVQIGYLPTGSGNDLARGLNLTTDPELAIKTILHPEEIRSIHIGTVQTETTLHHFIVSSGLGFDASVCHEAYDSKLKHVLNHLHLGKLSYLAIALKQLFLSKPCPMTLTLDEEKPISFPSVFFTAFMNTPYEGGGFMFCPDADPTDSFLDVFLVEKMSKWKILFLLPTAFWGKHTHFRGIHLYRCKKAALHAETPSALHTDGEPHDTPLDLFVSLSEEPLSFLIH